jgi:hypothetical protein
MRATSVLAVLIPIAVGCGGGGSSYGAGVEYRSDTRVEFTHVSGNNLRVMVHSPSGGQVEIPAGTVVSSGDASQQDLVTARPIQAQLEPNTYGSVELEGFCMNEERGNVVSGQPMAMQGLADPNVRRILNLADRVPHHDLQQAIWYLRGNQGRGNDPAVQQVLAMAGVEGPAVDPAAPGKLPPDQVGYY